MRTQIQITMSLSILALFSMQSLPVLAQAAAPTNWETNQTNAINQDAATGVINASQQAKLQNREAQIQAQQQQYMNQNGGTLLPGQKRQIDSELRGVNNHLNHDARYDATHANAYVNGVPGVAPQWQSAYPNQWQRQQWQNAAYPQQQQMQYAPPQYQNQNGQQYQHPEHHHRHYNQNSYGNPYQNNNGYHN